MYVLLSLPLSRFVPPSISMFNAVYRYRRDLLNVCDSIFFHRYINLYFESENVNSPISYHGDPPRYKSHSHGSRRTSLQVIVWADWCLRTTLVSHRYVCYFIPPPKTIFSDTKYYHNRMLNTVGQYSSSNGWSTNSIGSNDETPSWNNTKKKRSLKTGWKNSTMLGMSSFSHN